MLAAALWAIAGGYGCECGNRGQATATLVEYEGVVERKSQAASSSGCRTERVPVWQTATAGDILYCGDRLRTGIDAWARIRLAAGGQARMQAQSQVYFACEEDRLRFDLEVGEVDMTADTEAIEWDLAIGQARIEEGGRIRLKADPDRLTMEVLVGRAAVKTIDGKDARMGPGDRLELEIGAAVVRRIVTDETATDGSGAGETAPNETASDESGPDKSGPDKSGPDKSGPDKSGGADVRSGAGGQTGESTGDMIPAYAHFTIDAGESPVIYIPRLPPPSQPPLAVGVRLGQRCAATGGYALMEVSPSRRFGRGVVRSHGKGKLNIALARARTYHYRLRCAPSDAIADAAKEVVEAGSIQLVRDRGTRRLARAAPRNTIDADGRKYTVLYQNRLPQITFRWPNAPEAGRYVLQLQRDRRRAQTIDLSAPSYRLDPGELPEGHYRYFFTAGGRRSPGSELRIEFDNAAPSAYLREPQPAQPWTGDTLNISGGALPGWAVSIAGMPVATDRQGRFEYQLPLPHASSTIAVRLSHPQRGVRYYLRQRGQ